MATRKIDTELTLTGEKEFNDQMKAVNNSLKTTRSEMAVVTAEFGKNSTEIKALTAEHKILKQTLEDQKAKEKALSDQLKAAEQAYGKNSAQAQKYRQELNQARAAVINTENALEANTKAMLTQNAAAKALGKTFSAVAKGALAVTKATGKLIAGGTVGALVAAGGAAVVAAKGFQQLGKFAVEAAEAKDDQGNPLYKQYAQLGENLTGLKTASGAAKAALGSILLPALESLSAEGTQFLNDFSAAMEATEGDTQKMGEVVGEYIGRGAQLIAEKLPEYLSMAGEIVSALGTGISDNLPLILDSAGELLQTLTDGLIAAAPGIGTVAVDVVMSLVGFLIENAPELLNAGLELLESVSAGITDALPELIPAAVQMITQLLMALVEHAPELVASGLTLIVALVEGIINAAPELIIAAGESVKTLVEGFVEKWPDIKAIGKNAVEAIKQGILDAWEKLKAWFSNLWDSLFGNLRVNVSASGSSSTSGGSSGGGRQLPQLDVGMDRIPYDGFVAALHKNEAVLTAAEAARWRAGQSSGSTNTMNVYTQSLTESEIDYLFARFNREFGRAI